MIKIEELKYYLGTGLTGELNCNDVVENWGDVIKIKEMRSDNFDFFCEFCKPIMHPLSDLTKPIKVEGCNNGEEFVPMDRIKNLYLRTMLNYEYEFCGDKFYGLRSKDGKKVSMIHDGQEILPDCEFEVFSLLARLNFDLFGLIKRGDAIDINTLENK